MLNFLYNFIAGAMVWIHDYLTGPVLGRNSGIAWWLSIVVLVLALRLVLFPLFKRQIKSQRQMQIMQPKIKELKEKYRNDKERLNQEMMKLQKEHGNPLLGCLPIFMQIPIFIALFHVLRSFQPDAGPNGTFLPSGATVGLSADRVNEIANAKVFNVSIAAAFRSPEGLLQQVGSEVTPVRITCGILIVIMAALTYLTQRQIFGRNPATDPAQAIQQKLFLYGSPIMLFVTGFFFPVGVLLYWCTTNLWSLGQQFYVLRAMPPLRPDDPLTGGAPAKPRQPSPNGGSGAGKALTPPSESGLDKLRRRLSGSPRPGVGPPATAAVAMPRRNAPRSAAARAAAAARLAATESGSSGTAGPVSDRPAPSSDAGPAGSSPDEVGGRTAQNGGTSRPVGAPKRSAANRPAPKNRAKGSRKGGRR